MDKSYGFLYLKSKEDGILSLEKHGTPRKYWVQWNEISQAQKDKWLVEYFHKENIGYSRLRRGWGGVEWGGEQGKVWGFSFSAPSPLLSLFQTGWPPSLCWLGWLWILIFLYLSSKCWVWRCLPQWQALSSFFFLEVMYCFYSFTNYPESFMCILIYQCVILIYILCSFKVIQKTWNTFIVFNSFRLIGNYVRNFGLPPRDLFFGVSEKTPFI